MLEKIKEVENQVTSEVIKDTESLELFRIRYLSRKGILSQLFETFKEIPGKEKAAIGKSLNVLKEIIQQKLETAQSLLSTGSKEPAPPDLTLPGRPANIGSRHPISLVLDNIVRIFEKAGFSLAYGPEIEDDWHNFTGLNFEADHPAREMQDTFFISEEWLLRTHTSNVQVRIMEQQAPPIRVLAPGRVYRNEAISARSHCFFYQVEGFYIDRGVSVLDLKNTLEYFVTELFGKNAKTRFRASYFPFTEISAEVDVSCFLCQGKGCRVCKETGWVEILGCGMIDPSVLTNCHIDPDEYSGYAFGLGVDRLAMLLYQIPDIRYLTINDVRFLSQFATAGSLPALIN